MNTGTIAPRSGGLFVNNPIIASYAFPGNERIPQKIAAELNFFITKITRILDKKAGTNTVKKARYYKAVDLFILNRWKKVSSEREKRILEYLHTRLITVSKGLLSETLSSRTTVVPEPTRAYSGSVTDSMKTKTDIGFSYLGIDFSHPALIGYDYTQTKRFPKTITTVLDRFTYMIVDRITSENLSKKNKEHLYDQVFSILDEKMRTSVDIKELKIVQYIRNHVYIRQQEEKIGEWR